MCVIYVIIGLVAVILLALSFLVAAPLLLLLWPLVFLMLKLLLGLVLLYLIGRGVVWLLGRRRPPPGPSTPATALAVSIRTDSSGAARVWGTGRTDPAVSCEAAGW
jgi:hypothetical protein